MAGAHRLAVARSATCLWPLEQPVPAVSPVAKSGVCEGLFKAMNADLDLDIL